MKDDLSDVNLGSDRFRDVFPTGRVPIRDTRGFLALLRYGLEAIDGIDVDRYAQIRDEYIILTGEFQTESGGIGQYNRIAKDKKAIIRELHENLTFEQIARYVERPIYEVLDDFHGHKRFREQYQAILEGEEE